MNVLNNKLICLISIILIINNVYGQPPGGDGDGAKVQTDLVLNVSCNKSPAYDNDNVAIQCVLSNVGTKKNHVAESIIIYANIQNFSKPSKELVVTNHHLEDTDPQNPRRILNTSKVTDTDNYKLELDTNGDLIIDCPKLNSNNSIRFNYSTYLEKEHDFLDENYLSLSRTPGRISDANNVIKITPHIQPISLSTREPTIMSPDILSNLNGKYYTLNNSRINITQKDKALDIFRINGMIFNLSSDKRINRSGEIQFGIQIPGESPRFNQSIITVENLATYHTNNYKYLLFSFIICISLIIYSAIFKKISRLFKIFTFRNIMLQILAVSFIWLLQWTIIENIMVEDFFHLYYPNIIMLELVSSLLSYVILINLPNSLSGNHSISHPYSILLISFCIIMIYISMPMIFTIITSPLIYLALINIIGLTIPLFITLFILVIILYLLDNLPKSGRKLHYITIISAILFSYLAFSVLIAYSLIKSFEYPVSYEAFFYIGLINMSLVIIVGIALTDTNGFWKACQSIPRLRSKFKEQKEQ